MTEIDLKPILVVGSINIDLTVYLDRWAKPGETIAARQGKIALGGKGANQAVACARLGADVAMIGSTGRDAFGTTADTCLSTEGVNANIIRSETANTGIALIDVNAKGANMIRVVAGANGEITPRHVATQYHTRRPPGVLLLQNEIPLDASLEAARLCRLDGGIAIMDPAPAPRVTWSKDQLSRFDILKPNAFEAAALLGHDIRTRKDAVLAARAILELGPRAAIVTMGALGAAWADGTGEGFCNAPRIDAIDTVGAGDCFSGGLAYALAKGEGMQAAVDFAVSVAALSTLSRGALDSAPGYAAVAEFRRKHSNIHSFAQDW